MRLLSDTAAAQFNGKRLPKSFPVLTSERDPAAVAVPRSGVRRDQRRKGKSSQTQLYTGRQFNAQAPGVLSGAEMKTATIKVRIVVIRDVRG